MLCCAMLQALKAISRTNISEMVERVIDTKMGAYKSEMMVVQEMIKGINAKINKLTDEMDEMVAFLTPRGE